MHAKDKGGLVPLHNACSYGHYEVTERLLKVRARSAGDRIACGVSVAVRETREENLYEGGGGGGGGEGRGCEY